MSKKTDVTLIPRYEGKSAIQYERIRSTIRKTIRKTRLYKFIGVPYSQPLILRLKRVIELLEIVDMPVNQARLLCEEMSTLMNTKKFCQECVVGRRPLKSSRTGEFSSTTLLMEGAQKIEWKCIRWLSKPLL
jgi:hypothetical protein